MIHCVILLLKKGVLIYVMIILLDSLTKILQMKKSVKVAFFTLMNKAKKEQTACLPAFLSYFLTLLTFIAFNTTKTRISIFFLVLFSFSALALLSFIHMYIHIRLVQIFFNFLIWWRLLGCTGKGQNFCPLKAIKAARLKKAKKAKKTSMAQNA